MKSVEKGNLPIVVIESDLRAVDTDGTTYRVRAFAEPRGKQWPVWLELEPESRDLPVLSTAPETQQPSEAAAAHWLSALGPLYLQGAVTRARLRAGVVPTGSPVLVRAHETGVCSDDGTEYVARTYAHQEPRGLWVGSIEFRPRSGDGSAPVRLADRETTQPSLHAVMYWSRGLESVYLDGAFQRSRLAESREKT
jgi:hypothetical protein